MKRSNSRITKTAMRMIITLGRSWSWDGTVSAAWRSTQFAFSSRSASWEATQLKMIKKDLEENYTKITKKINFNWKSNKIMTRGWKSTGFWREAKCSSSSAPLVFCEAQMEEDQCFGRLNIVDVMKLMWKLEFNCGEACEHCEMKKAFCSSISALYNLKLSKPFVSNFWHYNR